MNPVKENIPDTGTETHQTEADLSQSVTAATEALRAVIRKRDSLCVYCGRQTNSLAADPGEWALRFSHEGGLVKHHHVTCVVQRLRERDELLALLKESLKGCTQTEYRDWKARAEAAIEKCAS